jgi:hypothetical protein
MTKDDVMEIARATSGAHWMDEAHIQRIATAIRNRSFLEATWLAERKSHPTYVECANAIRELVKKQ